MLSYTLIGAVALAVCAVFLRWQTTLPRKNIPVPSGIALLLLLGALPLIWFRVLGPVRLHELAAVLFAGWVLMRYGVPDLARGHGSYVVATACGFVGLWFGMNLFHGVAPVLPLRQGVYVVVMVAVVAYVRQLPAQGWRRVGWAAAVASVIFCLALLYSATLNGVNALETIRRGVTAGDPEIITRQLFRASFEGFGYDEDAVRGNLRHRVFGALLLAGCVAVIARPAAGARRWLHDSGTVASMALVVFSLSRAVWVAGLVAPLAAGARALVTLRLVRPAPLLALGLLGATGLALGRADLGVLRDRVFEDTNSYSGRLRLLQQSFERIGEAPILGGFEVAGSSAHVMVLDAWLRGGIVLAFAASAFVLSATVLATSAGALFWRDGSAAALALLVVAALPVVRMFTAGGGSLEPVEWVAIGVVLGALGNPSVVWKMGPLSQGRSGQRMMSAGSPQRVDELS